MKNLWQATGRFLLTAVQDAGRWWPQAPDGSIFDLTRYIAAWVTPRRRLPP